MVVVIMAIIGFFVGLFLAVVIGQRIIQRHVFQLKICWMVLYNVDQVKLQMAMIVMMTMIS